MLSCCEGRGVALDYGRSPGRQRRGHPAAVMVLSSAIWMFCLIAVWGSTQRVFHSLGVHPRVRIVKNQLEHAVVGERFGPLCDGCFTNLVMGGQLCRLSLAFCHEIRPHIAVLPSVSMLHNTSRQL